jgi:hypothetical protein
VVQEQQLKHDNIEKDQTFPVFLQEVALLSYTAQTTMQLRFCSGHKEKMAKDEAL